MVLATPNSLAETFKLRDYQIQGVEFLQERKRAMLLDAPGLGKTPQATFAAKPPALVVCPSYLVLQWRDWLKSLGFTVTACTGLRPERYKALQDMSCEWMVVNIEMLNNFPFFKDSKWKRHWRTIIFDESHHLKSHNGIRSRIAVDLSKTAEYVFLLSATPIKREIDDLYMQFRIIQPEIFTSYWRFVKQFCVVEQNHFGTQILGAKKSMLKELQQVMDILALGRSYEDAGRQLPPVIESTIPVELNSETRRLYDELIDFWRVQIGPDGEEDEGFSLTNYMQCLHLLRQHLTGYLKTDVIKGLIEDDKIDRRAVIFSWYKETARAMADSIAECAVVDGDVADMEERRNRARNSKHVSATIASISEGIDLSAARKICFAEEDFTPGSNYQAYSRVIRDRNDDGKDLEPVLVYYVLCSNTVDESIHDVSRSRAGTAKEVVKSALYLTPK